MIRSGGPHNYLIEHLATTNTIEMERILKSKYGFDGSNLFVYQAEQGKHEEISWQAQFPMFVEMYFGKG